MDEALSKFLKFIMYAALSIWMLFVIIMWIEVFVNFKQFIKDLKDLTFWLIFLGIPIFAALLKVITNNLTK